MSRSKKSRVRRSWSASEKMRIVFAGMESSGEVSELCRREGISPTQYYTWKKQLLGNAEAVFADRRGEKRDRQAEAQEQELTRLRAVIAEITAENLELKKTL